jgi:hypothetical protein
VTTLVYVSGSAVRIPAFGKSSRVMGLLLCSLRTFSLHRHSGYSKFGSQVSVVILVQLYMKANSQL